MPEVHFETLELPVQFEPAKLSELVVLGTEK
jgi:hypothetical protein